MQVLQVVLFSKISEKSGLLPGARLPCREKFALVFYSPGWRLHPLEPLREELVLFSLADSQVPGYEGKEQFILVVKQVPNFTSKHKWPGWVLAGVSGREEAWATRSGAALT